MCDAYVALWGQLPDPRVAAFMLANTWMETGSGVSLIQYNWGNLMASSTSQLHWVPPWVRNPDHRLYGVPNIPDKFRAYTSHAEGARAYLSLLNRKYRASLEAAAVGDFRGASAELLAGGYCPDCSEGPHANSIESFAERFLEDRLFETQCGAELPALTEADYMTRGRRIMEVTGVGPRNAGIAALAFAVPVVALGVERFAFRPYLGDRGAGARVAGVGGVLALATLALNQTMRVPHGVS